MDTRELWERAVAFHGHTCGGLTIGYKAALYAIRLLELIGYDGRLVREAQRAAAEFEDTGIWRALGKDELCW